MAANGISCLHRAPRSDAAFRWRWLAAALILATVAGHGGWSRAGDVDPRQPAVHDFSARRSRAVRPNERPFSVRRDGSGVARASFETTEDRKPNSAQSAAPTPVPSSKRRAAEARSPATATTEPLVLPARDPSRQVPEAAGGAPSLLTALGGLLLVLALFLVVVWLLRRGMPQASTPLPSGVVGVLGRAPLAERQYVHLIRVGNKLLLVAASPAGVETLTEIVDPIEVDRLVGLCGQTSAGSVTNTFRQVMDQFSQQRPVQSFVGRIDAADPSDEPHAPRSKGPVHA